MKRWAGAAVILTVALVGCGTGSTMNSSGGAATATTPASGDVNLVKLKLPGMT